MRRNDKPFLVQIAQMARQGTPRHLSPARLAEIVQRLTMHGGLSGLAADYGLSVPDLLATLRRRGYSVQALYAAYLRYPESIADALHKEMWGQ